MLHTLCILLLTIVSYNVENLFDARHDTLKNDIEYTPDGARHWSYTRYQNKVEHIAQVICNIGQGQAPALVGLCEVENDNCVYKLCHAMPHFHYRPIHFESPDERGIDVALLYDPRQFTPIDSVALPVRIGADSTRDILFVTGVTSLNDTLYLFVCHLPSMVGGQAVSEWKRQAAKAVLQHKVDSILSRQPSARIVVMGDMNSSPRNDLSGLTNCMLPFEARQQGTHRYKGIWSCLDQFYISPVLSSVAQVGIYAADFLLTDDTKYLGRKPRRTFSGFRYDKDGYSDHLPIVLTLP